MDDFKAKFNPGIPSEAKKDENAQPSQAQAQHKKRSFLEKAKRLQASVERGIIEGALSAPSEVAQFLLNAGRTVDEKLPFLADKGPVGRYTEKGLEWLANALPREEVKKLLENKLFFQEFQPETLPERLGYGGGSAVGGGGALNLLRGIKGLQATGASLGALAGTGLGQTAVEEVTDNPLLQLLGGLGGALAGAGLSTGIRAIGKSGQVQTGIPEVEALRKKGYEFPLEARTTSKRAKSVQKLGSMLKAEAAERQVENVSKPIKQKLESLAQNISKKPIANEETLGRTLTDYATDVFELENKKLRGVYDAAKKKIPPGHSIKINKYIGAIDSLENSLKKSHSLSPAEKETLNKLTELKKAALTRGPGRGRMNAAEAIATKVSLNDLVGEPVQEGIKKKLRGISGILSSSVRKAAKAHPEFLEDFVNADRQSAKLSQLKELPLARRLIKGESPERIAKSLTSAKELRELKALADLSPQGKSIYNATRRFLLEETVGPAVREDGSINFRALDKALDSRKKGELLQEIAGLEGEKTLTELRNVSGIILKRAKEYLRQRSGIGEELIKSAETIAPIAETLSGHPVKAALSLGISFGKKQMTELLSDPKKLEEWQKLYQAAKTGSKGAFANYSNSFVQSVAKSTDKSEKSREEQANPFQKFEVPGGIK